MDATTSAVLVTASGVTIEGMILRGPGFGADHGHAAIEIRGGSAGAPVSNVNLTGNTISDWDGGGIHASFVDGFTFAENVVMNVYRYGIGAASVADGHIVGNRVSNVIGSGNAYGIYLSRGFGGLVDFPRSRDVEVRGNTIEDVPNWECLDTHAGQGIRFVDNIVRRCRFGIVLESSQDGGSEYVFAPVDVSVTGNEIESGTSDGSVSEGIWVAGAGPGVPGSSTELARGIVISDNYLVGWGLQSDADSAAVRVRDTSGLLITHNTVHESSPTAINVYYNNYSFDVADNMISDPWSNTGPEATGIYVEAGYNVGVVHDNTFQRATKEARYVLTERVLVLPDAHSSVIVR